MSRGATPRVWPRAGSKSHRTPELLQVHGPGKSLTGLGQRSEAEPQGPSDGGTRLRSTGMALSLDHGQHPAVDLGGGVPPSRRTPQLQREPGRAHGGTQHPRPRACEGPGSTRSGGDGGGRGTEPPSRGQPTSQQCCSPLAGAQPRQLHLPWK